MNYTYLLINTIVIPIAVWGWYKEIRAVEKSCVHVAAAMIGTGVSLFMLLIGIVAPVGAPFVTDSTPFQIEKTEYRVIVKTGVGEYQWTDAETVAKIAQIEKVTLVQQRNAWGFDIEKPVATLTFKDGTKK